MCEECRQSRCPSGCPNAPEPPMVHICSECGEAIVDGDDYYEIGGDPYCDDCVFHKTAEVDYD
jgi:hypothetical protein